MTDVRSKHEVVRRRIRSVSLSNDVECSRLSDTASDEFPFLVSTMTKSGNTADQIALSSIKLQPRSDFIRAQSCNCINHPSCCGYRATGNYAVTIEKLTEGLMLKAMRFNQLPDEIRLKVFSYLSVLERGVAAQVCRDWHRLMRDQYLWSSIDLSVFPVCIFASKSCRHECSLVCYVQYRHRLKRFLRYLIVIKPIISSLKFSLDIGDPADGYNELLSALIKVSKWQDLQFASLNWTETPSKRAFTWPQLNATWSTSEFKELVHRRRYRQRLFVRFFDLFTAAAPNLAALTVTYDWSERSIHSLLRLTKLRELTLYKYFRYSPVDPSAFRNTFSALPCLQRLTLELWTETGDGFAFYQIQSRSLRHLDISACRGVYLNEMQLPSLVSFNVSRSPLAVELPSGGLWQANVIETPCMIDVLRDGAPHLLKLNEHTLHPDWHDWIYPELGQVLHVNCSCSLHRPC